MRPKAYTDTRIFESITIVLAKQGLNALTLQNIASQAQLSPAILSKRFGSKNKLLLAYYDYLIQITKESFEALDKMDITVSEKLKIVFLQWYNYFKLPSEFANISIFYLTLDMGPDFIEKSKERLRIVDDAVKKILKLGMDTGELRKYDINDLSLLLQSSATGVFILWCKTNSEKTPEEMLQQCFHLILE